ncbi:MAG: ABC transporter permease [Candidatus Wallbacteria bacterium]|nr:ABC transporter permease [Candidatus Wallbacteria bacterium]
MRKIAVVALKELRQVSRDPLSLLMLLGLPAMMLVLYGYAISFDVRHVALAVQDRDRTRASRELVATFVNSSFFDVAANPQPGDDLEALTQRLVAKAILVIPEGYARELHAGRPSPVQFLVDGADANTATTILGYADALLASTAGARRQPIRYQPRVWYNPELSSTRFLVPGLMGMLLMLTAVLSTAMSIVREKERGTLEQIRVSPISGLQFILGKTLPYLGISLLAAAIILLAARVLFGIAVRGSYLELLGLTLLYLTGALGLGLLVSTVADSQALAFQQALLVSMLPSVLLSGFIFPIANMPEWLRAITCAVPARFYLVALRGVILKGAPLEVYSEQVAALAAFAAVMLVLATRRLAREVA